VSIPDEARSKAEECREKAEKSIDLKDKAVWLRIADLWMKKAQADDEFRRTLGTLRLTDASESHRRT
jgi:hypothetical protein